MDAVATLRNGPVGLIVALCALSLVVTTSCSPKLVVFTPSMVSDHNLSADQVKSLQFYLGSEYRMSRLATSHGDVRARRKLVIEQGRQFEVVEMRDRTPGVVDSVTDDFRTMFVSFEPGCSLRFERDVADTSYTPVQYLSGDSLLTLYDGNFYRAVGCPPLKIERDAIYRLVTKRRVVPGMQLK